MAAKPEQQKDFYLPDFCGARSVLAVVLISELVALVLTLAREELRFSFWLDLARTSLFLLWIGMCSAAILCALRPRLAQMDTYRASVLALTSLVGVVVAVSEATFWIGRPWLGAIGLSEDLFPVDHASFLLRNAFIGFIVSALALRYFFVANQWRRNVELKARSRLDALQARIQPHFLFNSMNTIAALTRSDPRLAEEAVEDLADLFRANLKETRHLIPLEEELAVARLYQRIESLRLGSRLKVQWDIDALPKHTLVPSLMVQPLLENAIYHGVERLPEGGTVSIHGASRDGRIELTVSNPVMPAAGSRPGGHHIALENIRERLELAFPGRSRMDVSEHPDRYDVTLTFPA